MKRPKIISFGEILWDLYPEEERIGGAPANFACHAALLGAEVTMVSAVGDDMGGRTALEILGGYGIDVSLIGTVASAPTGTVGVELAPQGKPVFSIHEHAAWDCFSWSEEIDACLADADAVYFGTLGQRSEQTKNTIQKAIRRAKALDLPRVLDINLRAPFFDDALICESIKLASTLKLSDEELPLVCEACGLTSGDPTEQRLRHLRKMYGLDQIAMTRGAKGALLVTPDEAIDQPGIPAKVNDTVGAGDAFTAAFVIGLLRREQPIATLLRACELAAEVCSQSGAVPKAPILM